MSRLTKAHPDLRLEVVDRFDLGAGRAMFDVHFLARGGKDWGRVLRALPGVEEVELIDATKGSEVCRVVVRGTTFLPLMRRLRLFRQLPFPVQGGVSTWTVVGPAAKVRGLLRRLEAQGVPIQTELIRSGPFPRGPPLLTPRQQEVLRRATSEGYFDVPRRISLTRLAPRIGVAVSTLSVTLAVIEKKIVLGESEPAAAREAVGPSALRAGAAKAIRSSGIEPVERRRARPRRRPEGPLPRPTRIPAGPAA
jgi:predicted DNA binding protein